MTAPFDRYLAGKCISPEQHAAAVRFRETAFAYRAVLRRRHHSPLARIEDPAEREAAAEFIGVIERLGEHRHVLLAVVVRGLGVSTWAREQALRPSDGLPRLRAALDALVAIYRERRVA